MDYTSIMNSPLLWLACGFGVALVFFQATVMVYKSLKMGKRLGVTNGQITAAAVVGFAAMALFTLYNKKANKKWVREWAFCLSMLAGMLASLFFI